MGVFKLSDGESPTFDLPFYPWLPHFVEESDYTTCGGTNTPSDFSDLETFGRVADLPVDASLNFARRPILGSSGLGFDSLPPIDIAALLSDLLTKLCAIPPAVPSGEPRSVFIGNIPPGVSLFAFQSALSAIGPTDFCFFSTLRTDLENLPPPTGDGWKCSLATFSHSSSAKICVQSLNGKRIFASPAHHKLVCCFAPSTPKSVTSISSINCQSLRLNFQPLFDGSTVPTPPSGFSLLRDGPAGSNLFVYGLPSDWTEVPLLELCQEFGHVVGVRVPLADCDQGPSSQERLNRGFGFVSYDCCDSAFKALSKLATSTLLTKQLKVQLKSGEGHLCPNELSHFVQNSRRPSPGSWEPNRRRQKCRR